MESIQGKDSLIVAYPSHDFDGRNKEQMDGKNSFYKKTEGKIMATTGQSRQQLMGDCAPDGRSPRGKDQKSNGVELWMIRSSKLLTTFFTVLGILLLLAIAFVSQKSWPDGKEGANQEGLSRQLRQDNQTILAPSLALPADTIPRPAPITPSAKQSATMSTVPSTVPTFSSSPSVSSAPSVSVFPSVSPTVSFVPSRSVSAVPTITSVPSYSSSRSGKPSSMTKSSSLSIVPSPYTPPTPIIAVTVAPTYSLTEATPVTVTFAPSLLSSDEPLGSSLTKPSNRPSEYSAVSSLDAPSLSPSIFLGDTQELPSSMNPVQALSTDPTRAPLVPSSQIETRAPTSSPTSQPTFSPVVQLYNEIISPTKAPIQKSVTTGTPVLEPQFETTSEETTTNADTNTPLTTDAPSARPIVSPTLEIADREPSRGSNKVPFNIPVSTDIPLVDSTSSPIQGYTPESTNDTPPIKFSMAPLQNSLPAGNPTPSPAESLEEKPTRVVDDEIASSEPPMQNSLPEEDEIDDPTPSPVDDAESDQNGSAGDEDDDDDDDDDVPANDPVDYLPTLSPISSPTSYPVVSPERNPTSEPSMSLNSPAPTALTTQAPSVSIPDDVDRPIAPAPTQRPIRPPTPPRTRAPVRSPVIPPTARPNPPPISPPVNPPRPPPRPTGMSTPRPTARPVRPNRRTSSPSLTPTLKPSATPSLQPSLLPSPSPSGSPTVSVQPSTSLAPSANPTPSFLYDKISLLSEGIVVVANLESRRLQEDSVGDRALCLDPVAEFMANSIKNEVEQVVLTFETLNVSIVNSTSRRDEKATSIIFNFDVLIEIRSILTVHDMRRYIGGPFDSQNEKDAFVSFLRSTSCPELSRVRSVDILLPTELELADGGSKSSGGLIFGILVGIAVVAVLTGTLIFAMLRNRRLSSQKAEEMNREEKSDPFGKNSYERHEYMSEIGLQTVNDMSSLGDPIPHGASASLADLATLEPRSIDYDFREAYMDRQEASIVSDPIEVSSKAVSISVADDSTLNAQYATWGKWEVLAPKGLLGLVLETNDDGFPVVKSVRETSVLFDQVNIGDILVSVDGHDVAFMLTSEVSRLIASKQEQQCRKLDFIRPV